MRTKTIRSIWLAGISAALCGCCPAASVKPIVAQPPTETVALTDVLNKVKDELNAYQNLQEKEAAPTKGVCYDNKEAMTLNAQHVVVTLKTVVTRENDGNGGSANAIGILKINPSVEYDAAEGRTQTITIAFDVAKTPPQPMAPGDHDLANAIVAIRNGIASVNHDKSPCIDFGSEMDQIKKPPIQLSVQFEVKRDATATLGFNLVVLKLSDKEKLSSDYLQTIAIDLVSTQSKAIEEIRN